MQTKMYKVTTRFNTRTLNGFGRAALRTIARNNGLPTGRNKQNTVATLANRDLEIWVG